MRKLTPRELEVMGFLKRGLTDKEIAKELELSAQTVRHHLHSAYIKLGANSRITALLALEKLIKLDKK